MSDLPPGAVLDKKTTAQGLPPGAVLDKPAWWQSLWSGVVHGAGNVLHGGARIGARMGEAPEIGQIAPSFTPQRTQQVDETARQREATYQASPEKKAHPIVAGLGEVGGEAAGTAAEMGPLAGVAGAPGWMGRLLGGAAVGAGASLATPKGGESMAPAAQLQRGGAGALGGVAGVAVPATAGKLLSAIVGHDERAIGEAMTSAYRRIIKPGKGQKKTGAQLDAQDRSILGSTDSIIKSRKAAAAGTGAEPQYPASVKEYVDALGETKKSVFQEYDLKTQRAGGQTLTATSDYNPHMIAPFQRTGVAVQEAQNAVRDAQQHIALTNMPQNSNGRMLSQQRMRQAQATLQNAQQQHAAVTEMMKKPYVDLAPISSRLKAMTEESSFADLAPSVAGEIRAQADRLSKRGFYGLTETQDVLQTLNSKLNAFYRNPTPSDASRAVADAEMAGMLRTQLNETIDKLDGPGYAALKKQYGDLRKIEEEAVAGFNREANKVQGGIGGIFADLWATSHGLKAIGTLDVHALASAVATKAGQAILKKLRDPNRAVQRLFTQRAYEPGQAQAIIGGLSRSVPPMGALPGGLGMSYEIAPKKEPPKRDIRPSAVGG